MTNRKIKPSSYKRLSTVFCLLMIAGLPVLVGCAHGKNEDASPLTTEKKAVAAQIDSAQFEGRLTPTEADLQKDSLRHNFKF